MVQVVDARKMLMALDGYHINDLNTRKWLTYFHDIMLLELSTAQIKKAKHFHLGDVITGSSANKD